MIESDYIKVLIISLYFIFSYVLSIYVFKRRNPHVKGPTVYLPRFYYKHDWIMGPLSLLEFIGLLILLYILEH